MALVRRFGYLILVLYFLSLLDRLAYVARIPAWSQVETDVRPFDSARRRRPTDSSRSMGRVESENATSNLPGTSALAQKEHKKSSTRLEDDDLMIKKKEQETVATSNTSTTTARTVLRQRQQAQPSSDSDDEQEPEVRAGAVAVYLTHTSVRSGDESADHQPSESFMFDDIDQAEIGMLKKDGKDPPHHPGVNPTRPSNVLLQGELVTSQELSIDERKRIEAETAQKMIGGIVQAEAVQEQSLEAQKGKKRRFAGWIILGFVILVFVIVGVSVGVVLSRDSKDSAESNPSSTGSKDKTLSRPPSTAAPVQVTTQAPATRPPSQVPSSLPSPEPSLGPTFLGDNSDCLQAHPIRIGQTRQGEYVESSGQPDSTCFFDCPSGLGCVGKGIPRYYTYMGEGHAVSASTTVGYIKVFPANEFYASQNNCASDQCEASAVTVGSSGSRDTRWLAQEGVRYVLEVVCYHCSDVGAVPFELSLYRNDQPERSYGPLVLSETTFLSGVIDTNQNTSSLDLFPACGSASSIASDSAWFTIVGTGNAIEVSTCFITSWDTQLSVFAYDEGNESWQCVGGNDDTCGSGQSTVSWNSQSGSIYYIAVHGKHQHDQPADSPLSFTIQIGGSGLGDGLVAGDICDTALPLQVGEPQSVVLGTATDDPDIVALGCQEEFGYLLWTGDLIPTGLFYQVQADLGDVDVVYFLDIVDVGYEGLMGVSILSGTSCLDLQCVDAQCHRNNGCSWMHEPGKTYYVYAYHETQPFVRDTADAVLVLNALVLPPPALP